MIIITDGNLHKQSLCQNNCNLSVSRAHSFSFSVRCRLVIFVVPVGRWTTPSGVGRWLFHGVCFLWNFLLARCFLFCGEGMTAWHELWFVLPVHSDKGLTFQCQSFSCGYSVCSGLFLAEISWSVGGAIVSEGCLVGEHSLHFCAWCQLASYFWWAFLLLGN